MTITSASFTVRGMLYKRLKFFIILNSSRIITECALGLSTTCCTGYTSDSITHHKIWSPLVSRTSKDFETYTFNLYNFQNAMESAVIDKRTIKMWLDWTVDVLPGNYECSKEIYDIFNISLRINIFWKCYDRIEIYTLILL